MDTNDWLKAHNPYRMFDYLGHSASARKLRLFGIACCRRIWNLMDEECRRAVPLAERLVEGQAREEAAQLRDRLKNEYLALSSHMNAQDKHAQVRLWSMGAARNLLQDDDAYRLKAPIRAGDADLRRVWYSASSAVGYFYGERVNDPPPDEQIDEFRAQADLLRDVLGNPLDPVEFDPRWNSAATTALAQSVYTGDAFDRLPILADALEEAGCADEAILAHCRSPGPHVRGCWVVDCVLGRA